MSGYPYIAHFVAKVPRASWRYAWSCSDQRILFTSKRGGVWQTAEVASDPTLTAQGGGWCVSVAHVGLGQEFLLVAVDWPTWPALRVYRSLDEGVSWIEVVDQNLGSFPSNLNHQGRILRSGGMWVYLNEVGDSFRSADGVTWLPGAAVGSFFMIRNMPLGFVDASGRLYMLDDWPSLRVLVSSDCGVTWEQHLIGGDRSLTVYGCHVLGNTVVVVSHVYAPWPHEGHLELAVTEDGGKTWFVSSTALQAIWPDLDSFGAGTRASDSEYLSSSLVDGKLYVHSASTVSIGSGNEMSYLISATSENWRGVSPTWRAQPHASQAVASGWDNRAWADALSGVGGSLFLFAPRRGDVWNTGEAWMALGLFEADQSWETPGTEVFSLTPGGVSDMYNDLLTTWAVRGNEVFTQWFLESASAGWYDTEAFVPPPPSARLRVGRVLLDASGIGSVVLE